MSGTPARVAVLGGGFAGLYSASYLAAAELLGEPPDVTLVSETNHFTFTPLLADVVGGALGREHVTFSHRVMARRRGFRFRLGRVEGLDPDAGTAHTSGGPVPFDYAVLALGAKPRWFGNRELERRSYPLTTVRDAEALRNRVLCQAELAATESSAVRRRRLLTFVVAGGGPAGVEAASEIWDLLTRVLPRYYDLGDAPRVVILDGGDRILRGWDRELARQGLEILRGQGIEVRLGTLVTGYDGEVVRLRPARADASSGGEVETLAADTLVWTAGVEPATAPLRDSPLPRTDSGHLAVNEYLGVRGHERLFAAGDATRLENPRTGRPYPPVAPIAISQGVRAAGNVENRLAGRPLESYRAHHAGKIVSLGSGTALVDVLGFRIRGVPAWALYRGTYILKMVGLKNKVRAGVTLLLNRLFERDLTAVE